MFQQEILYLIIISPLFVWGKLQNSKLENLFSKLEERSSETLLCQTIDQTLLLPHF